MARVGMGLIKNEHGVYHVRRKVPKALEEATATVMGVSKARVSWLKETLGTKDEKQAKVRAAPIMMKFNGILAKAEALLLEHPVRTELTEAEIKRIADYFYAHTLREDEDLRAEGGVGDDRVFADVHRQLTEAGVEFESPFSVEEPRSGLSDRMMYKIEESASFVLPAVREALARGNVDFIRYELNELLQVFRINLDPNCPDYRKLALAVMRAEVRALEDILARHRGDPIETPKLPEPDGVSAPSSGCGLRAAYEGWLKVTPRKKGTSMEFERGIERFIELHGDLEVAQINRGHVRQFRDAALLVPAKRSGKLLQAPLPELVEYSRAHPEVPRLKASTINKWLNCLGAVLNWARKNGIIPDEMPWSDPVSGMRLPEERSNRQPWEPEELSALFASPIYLKGERPLGGKGEAAFWLPLLGIFSGARLNELAPMRVEDVKTDAASGVRFMTVIEDEQEGRSVKTESSVRAIPIHSELVRVGFLEFVEHVRNSGGQSARLFPKLTPGSKGGFGEAFSKWFGRYKRKLGITNPSSVFHSFRHGFKDALRAASVNEDINDAITGHSGGNAVARRYGWKEMVRRFGFQPLADAVGRARYPGLDLSPVRWTVPLTTPARTGKHAVPGIRPDPGPEKTP
jgi:integrase